MSDTEVLIVGAGPTGLVLAHWLHRLGVSFRIVDKAQAPGQQSRALAVHARTLELYAQLGLAQGAIERGIVMPRLGVWRDRRRLAEAAFGPAGEGLTPYPYVLVFPQDDHERFLIDALEAEGVRIERGVELTDLAEVGGRWRATLSRDAQAETLEVGFVCGCDGAHSAVRHGLGVAFKGAPYAERFFVADVEAIGSAADRAFNLCLDAEGLCVVAPVRRTGAHRLIGLVPPDKQDKPDLEFRDVQRTVARVAGLTIRKVNWFSIYNVHHRMAERFRRGGAFLLGDAAHIHSPIGGQGLNTGVGDASNLAWKLAEVIRGRADPKLLDTYETERMAFARRLLASNDALFKRVADRGAVGRLWRTQVLPTGLPLVVGTAATRRSAFRTVSQIGIEYHASPLSAGGAGKVRGGDRLPWLDWDGGDNFAALQACDWRIHVYGHARPALQALAGDLGVGLDVFAHTPAATRAGFMKDALYLVRPDGYVAFAEPNQKPEALMRFLRRNGLRLAGEGDRGALAAEIGPSPAQAAPFVEEP
jgi:2-polyprenyl-6-methoxyphenol hydroxylase-like FAD-dependent oxidoreductase